VRKGTAHQRSLARLAAGAALALGAVALGAAGCGSSSGGSGSGSGPAAASGAGKTLTVWYMDGDLSSQAQAAINTAFEKATGAKVKVQIQEWDSVNTKISTA